MQSSIKTTENVCECVFIVAPPFNRIDIIFVVVRVHKIIKDVNLMDI